MLAINKNRKSGVELLKIFTCFFIVLFHCNMTFIDVFKNNLKISYCDNMISTFINLLGNLFNTIFIICSSWFLVKSHDKKNKKIVNIVISTFIISLLIMLIYVFVIGTKLSVSEFISCLLPISKGNNWFVTMYILLSIFSYYINKLLDCINEKDHLDLCLIIFLLYYVINFLNIGEYYLNDFVASINIYIIVSYFQKYKIDICQNVKLNIFIFLLSTISFVIVAYLNNVIMNFRVTSICNPFSFLIAFSLFNIFNSIDFYNNIVNGISSLTLYIYLTHENILFRTYTRPILIANMYKKLGTNCAIIKLFFFSFVIFILSVIISYLYKIFFDNFVKKQISKMYDIFKINCKENR